MRRNGFTLIEILVVIAIIGILAALFIPIIQSAIQKSKQKGTMKDMNTMATMITDYITNKGVAPVQDGRLAAGSEFYTALAGFYLKTIPVNDQWGMSFYVYCGTAAAGIGGVSGVDKDDFIIRSYGRDRAETAFAFDPLIPSSAYFEVDSINDFDQDLVLWNGSWIHAPDTKQMGAGT